MTIELGLTSDSRWGLGTHELVEAVKGTGFTSIGIAAETVDRDSAAELHNAGLRCHELMALVVSNNQPATLASAERLAEKAAEVEAEWVVTVFTANIDLQAFALIERCAAILSSVGTRMAVEFSPLGSVTSIQAGLDVVSAAGPERAGVLIDTWHFFRGESTWQDLAHIPLHRIAYVQFADALDPIPNDLMDETMNRRAMPGTGMFELERFATTLLERGWEGLVSVEVLSRELGSLSTQEFARAAHSRTLAYWS
ncbi:MAG TPA: sugar phosphate isomerase/epimerase [Acidimicrobiales bacterium]|nr:sugar phosphate isomerase/epimerase [Acidimicrobiales bacterium]